MSSAINVEKIPERIMVTPLAPTEEDFSNPPTTGPVVRTESRAEQEQERPVLWSSIVAQGHKTVPNLSEEAQKEIKKITTQVIESQIKQMLPQILTKVAEALNLTIQ